LRISGELIRPLDYKWIFRQSQRIFRESLKDFDHEIAIYVMLSDIRTAPNAL
jgi:hypothetical protein